MCYGNTTSSEATQLQYTRSRPKMRMMNYSTLHHSATRESGSRKPVTLSTKFCQSSTVCPLTQTNIISTTDVIRMVPPRGSPRGRDIRGLRSRRAGPPRPLASPIRLRRRKRQPSRERSRSPTKETLRCQN